MTVEENCWNYFDTPSVCDNEEDVHDQEKVLVDMSADESNFLSKRFLEDLETEKHKTGCFIKRFRENPLHKWHFCISKIIQAKMRLKAKYFADVYNEFDAPCVGMYALSKPILIIKDPELIKSILIKDFNVFSNRSFYSNEKIDPIFSNALSGIKTPYWKELRRKLSPVFTSGKIKMMMPLMLECGKNLEKYISDMLNENIEMKEVAARYTTDVITSCAFGFNADSFGSGNSEFREHARLIFATSPWQRFKNVSYILAPIFVKILKYPFFNKKVTDYFRKIFNDTLLAREKSEVKRNDLVDILNEIKNEENSSSDFKFEGDRIFAQAFLFFGAGHETTSSTIAFTLHELSVNQEIQEQLREEILREIEDHGGLTYEAVQNMKYLHMVVSETLRKYSLTPLLNREAITDYRFEETGLVIDKGTATLISQHALHWDPKYFPEPEKFDPERFSDVNKSNIPNYVYLPFGDGPRNCIGERFGLLSSKLGIILVVQKFKVERNSETRHPLVFTRSPILLSKYGIPFFPLNKFNMNNSLLKFSILFWFTLCLAYYKCTKRVIMLSLQNAILFCLFLLGCIYVYFQNKFNYWKRKGVPHRQPIIPFGNLLELILYKESISKYFAGLYKEFDAPCIGMYGLAKPFLLIKDPELIKSILIKDFNIFPNRAFYCNENIDPIISNALLGIEAPQWKDLRKRLSPVFTSGKMKMMMPLMLECGKNLEKYITETLNQNIEMKDVASKYTTDVITSCAFGLNADSFGPENTDFREHAKLIFSSSPLRILKNVTYVFAPMFVKIFKYSFFNDRASNYFRKIFNDTLQTRENSPVKRNDLVDILNEIKNGESSTSNFGNKVILGDRIFAQAFIFFGAGYETTSSTIAFTLHELSVNINVQEKLRDEIFREIEKHGDLSYEAVQNMKYLDMIVSETLRKYSLTPLLHRKAIQDYKFEGTSLVIDKGTTVLISQEALHWDHKFFPQPEKYDPERFNEVNKHSFPNYVYLPFGDGPRNCIGERFALLSSKLGIIQIIRKFKVEKNSETRHPLVFSRSPILLSKYGIPLTCVSHRKPVIPFGHVLEIASYKDFPAKYFADLYNEFEDATCVGMYAMTKPILIVKDPELIKSIMIKDFNVFSNRSFFNDETIDPVMSNSLLGIKTPHWKELRKKLSPVFSSGKIKMMMPLMLECGKSLEEYITSMLNKNLETKEVAAKYTTDVITSCAFGLNANSFAENNEFRHYAKMLFTTSVLQSLKALSYLFAPIFVKIFKYPFIEKEPTDFFRKVFNETMRTREASKIKRNDLVDILNEIKNAENNTDSFKFDGDRIFAQALIFFGAGYETSSSTIAFTLHELSINSEIQQKLRNEILEVIEKHGELTYEAVQDMKYLDMVISETLRKYPLTPILNREAVRDYKFESTGLVIEKGTTVLITQQGLHWDPKYFPEPEKYDPERFSDNNKSSIPNYVYLPFGDGPRNCIGKKFNYWKSKGVVHRKPIIPFGNILEMAFYKDFPAKYFADLYTEFNAPCVGIYAFTKPILIIKDPELIKSILIKDFNVFPNRSFFTDEKIDPIVSNALIGIKTPYWKELRKKLSPVFSSGKIKMMMPLILQCGKNLEEYIRSMASKNLEMKEVAAKYTTDVITSCAFGLNANSFAENSEFRHYGNMIFPATTLQGLKALSYIFAPTLVKIFRYTFINMKGADFFRKVFNDTLKGREVTKMKRNDLVDILNEIKNEEKSTDTFKFEGDRIFAQALIFFAAGYETTSSTIAFTLHELSVNVDVQQKLREEILKVIEKYGGLTYEAVQDMKYLHMVISETLRKYSLTPILNREAVSDYKFEKTGLVIDKGTIILITQQGLHWDPQYFPEPEKYNPERFSDDNKDKIPNYVYLPFGDGPRNCIGERFGLLSSKLGVIQILREFKVEKNSKTRHPLEFSRSPILLSKYGVPLSFTNL
ncbi:hypothetical protein FQR65_LT11531 [Abscondita terminalis]|nr:hypothetical protein FQR65_LT11531 [Abscondita terminalis]